MEGKEAIAIVLQSFHWKYVNFRKLFNFFGYIEYYGMGTYNEYTTGCITIQLLLAKPTNNIHKYC